MDGEEVIASVQYENEGIPNNRDIDYIYQYYASLEQARAAEARENEEALRKARQAKNDKKQADKAGNDSSSDSDSDSDDSSSSSDSDADDDALSHEPETEPTPTDTVAEPTTTDAVTESAEGLEQAGDKTSADQTETVNKAETDGKPQQAQSPEAEAEARTAGPSSAAESLAAQLLAKHTAPEGPESGMQMAKDDDEEEDGDSSDDDDDDEPSYRLTHEELEEMILREEGKVQKVREPEDSEPAPKFPEVTVGEQDAIEPVGSLHAFIDKSLHFWQDAKEEHGEENDRILLEGSVICLEDRRVLGGVFDMMGPMRAKKLYQIKYNKDKFQEIKSWNLERGTKMFRVSAHSTWGHVNQFTAGDEAFDEVYEGEEDDDDAGMETGEIDDAEVLMRRQQDGGRAGRAGRRGGFQDRGRGRGRGGRGGQNHPRGHNQFRGGRGNSFSSPDHGRTYGSRPSSSYGQPAPPPPPQGPPAVPQFNPALGQAESAMTPQYFQALMLGMQQVQRQAQQQGQVAMPPPPPQQFSQQFSQPFSQPFTQPFVNQNFQQPAYNPFAWGGGQGQVPQPPQMNAYQQHTPQPPPEQAYQTPAVPQFGSALPAPQPSFQGSTNGQRGAHRGRARGARGRGSSRPRHPDDPSEFY